MTKKSSDRDPSYIARKQGIWKATLYTTSLARAHASKLYFRNKSMASFRLFSCIFCSAVSLLMTLSLSSPLRSIDPGFPTRKSQYAVHMFANSSHCLSEAFPFLCLLHSSWAYPSPSSLMGRGSTARLVLRTRLYRSRSCLLAAMGVDRTLSWLFFFVFSSFSDRRSILTSERTVFCSFSSSSVGCFQRVFFQRLAREGGAVARDGFNWKGWLSSILAVGW